MAKKQSRRDRVSEIDDLMEKLAANFSEDEIVNIFGNSLLALDDAGFERMAAGLGKRTSTALKRVLKAGASNKSDDSKPSVSKILQEWESGWREWDARIAETADEGGKYTYQENRWEAPYLDNSAFSEDLEPIAARLQSILPIVLEKNLAPRFNFAQALLNTAEEIGGNSEYIEDSGEGLSFGPKVTRCLLDWEWRQSRRDNSGAFEFLDCICSLENSGKELHLDHSTISNFIFSLEPEIQKEMLRGIDGHCQSGHWAKALKSVNEGWFALHKKLCRKWDPSRFLEVCQKSVSQDWKLALPLIDNLCAKKAFQEAVALAQEAARALLRKAEGNLWDPRKSLIMVEAGFPYDGERSREIRALLKRWEKASLAVKDMETACALELQLAILDCWADGDAVFLALQSVPRSFEAIEDRIYKDWKSLIAMHSVESPMDEFSELDYGWIHGLIDAVRAGEKGPAAFRRVVLCWLDQTEKTRASVNRGFYSLAVLTLDLNSGAMLKKASPALHRLLLRERMGNSQIAALRRKWLKSVHGEELLPKVIQFWKRNATQFVPEPEHSASDYRDCADWLAVLRDFDPSNCKKILELWKLKHKRRKSLWRILERANLISH
jgi:hypothetical protein